MIAIGEFVELLSALRHLISGARPMTPKDLVAPGSPTGGIDTSELQARADAAETRLRAATQALQGGTGLDTALLNAANFGVFNAIPSADASQWSVQAIGAAAGLNARVAALDKLAAGFTRSGSSNDVLRDHDVSRLKAIFGDGFLVLPTLDAATSERWIQLWSGSVALQAGDPLAATAWMQRMARIRPAVSRLYKALLYSEALAGQTRPPGDVAQLPPLTTGDEADKWVALDRIPSPSASRLSLVNFAPQPAAAGAAIAGLMVDEWVEVLPSAQQITGISFHADDPTARAPQAILLGVRPDDFPEWTLASVEGTILEALDLARLRAVDPDALNALGHYLPALYFAYNAGGPQVETISTDFNVVRAATLLRSN